MNKPIIAAVDDENDILDLYATILESRYDVRTFDTPEKFLKALQEDKNFRIDTLITDLSMPKMDGLQMIAKAQALGFRFPFIIMSAYLNKEKVIEAVNLGVYRLMEKPIQFDVLENQIDQLMIEHDIHGIQIEIRQMTSQLREFYSATRMMMSQYVPAEVLDRLVALTDAQGNIVGEVSFDKLIDNLESRLDKLMKSEKTLIEMKATKRKENK